MRYILITILLLLCSGTLFCQAPTTSDIFIYPKHAWGVSVIPVIYKKQQFYGDRSKYNIRSSNQFGGEILINYYYNFEKNYSIVMGVGGGILSHDFSFTIPKEDFNPPLDYDVDYSGALSREMDNFYFKLQGELLAKLENSLNKKWIVSAGLSVLYTPLGSLGYNDYALLLPNGQEELYLIDNPDYNNHGKPWFNFHISGGHEWIFKSGRSLQACLKINYSPVRFISGDYLFTVGNQPDVSGTYGVNGSYAGLNITYVFSRVKKI